MKFWRAERGDLGFKDFAGILVSSGILRTENLMGQLLHFVFVVIGIGSGCFPRNVLSEHGAGMGVSKNQM